MFVLVLGVIFLLEVGVMILGYIVFVVGVMILELVCIGSGGHATGACFYLKWGSGAY